MRRGCGGKVSGQNGARENQTHPRWIAWNTILEQWSRLSEPKRSQQCVTPPRPWICHPTLCLVVSDTNRTSDGQLQPDPSRFPSGMASLASYIHSKDLKLGLYLCIGEVRVNLGAPVSAPLCVCVCVRVRACACVCVCVCVVRT